MLFLISSLMLYFNIYRSEDNAQRWWYGICFQPSLDLSGPDKLVCLYTSHLDYCKTVHRHKPLNMLIYEFIGDLIN